jgi:hypothetical protein
MAKKPIDAARYELILGQIQQWMNAGWPKFRIYDTAHKLYDISRSDVNEIVASIRDETRRSFQIDRPEFVSQQLERLESLAAKAIEDGNLSVALGAYREIHTLIGLHATR